MAAIPQNQNTTINAIWRAYEARREGGFRSHLGASRIGAPCRRQLWYEFRWCKKPEFPGRVLRLFQRGQLEEEVFVADLRAAGCEVLDRDPRTGRQFQFADVGGHFGGSMDAQAKGLIEAPATWHVVEMKTHSAKSFADLEKKGVEASKPEHYAQMQVYMHWAGLTRAYYLAVNKDTDALYGERIKYNREFAEGLIEKARSIITASGPPSRMSDDPAFYLCKWCGFHGQCHGTEGPEINCRTCCHATPEIDGDARWSCAWWKGSIPEDFQREGCDQHRLIPALVQWAEAVDANEDENWIEYRCETNDGPMTFINGNDGKSGCLTSREIAALDPQTVTLKDEPEIATLRQDYDAEIVEAKAGGASA